METLWVDFQNTSDEGVRLNCNGTLAEIKEKQLELYVGLKLLIWYEDLNDDGSRDKLVAEAIVGYSEQEKLWFAYYDDLQLTHQ
jgi:hypothetical protein